MVHNTKNNPKEKSLQKYYANITFSLQFTKTYWQNTTKRTRIEIRGKQKWTGEDKVWEWTLKTLWLYTHTHTHTHK